MAARVLFVDDEEQVRTMFRHGLETLGYEVGLASNGSEALGELEHDDGYEIVVTDILMPEVDGIELLRQLRRDHPEVKVVVISSPGNSLYLDSAEGLGADAVIEKPFGIDTLADQLEELVSG